MWNILKDILTHILQHMRAIALKHLLDRPIDLLCRKKTSAQTASVSDSALRGAAV
jgi:hypothetical protein